MSYDEIDTRFEDWAYETYVSSTQKVIAYVIIGVFVLLLPVMLYLLVSRGIL